MIYDICAFECKEFMQLARFWVVCSKNWRLMVKIKPIWFEEHVVHTGWNHCPTKDSKKVSAIPFLCMHKIANEQKQFNERHSFVKAKSVWVRVFFESSLVFSLNNPFLLIELPVLVLPSTRWGVQMWHWHFGYLQMILASIFIFQPRLILYDWIALCWAQSCKIWAFWVGLREAWQT